MKKTIFVLAGFNFERTAESPAFAYLRKDLSKYYDRVVPLGTSWRYKTVSQMAHTFSELYEREKSEYNAILGNSLGAMTALIVAPTVKPERLWLASLSAFFKEDLPAYGKDLGPNVRPWLNQRRLEDFQKLSATELAGKVSKLDIPTTLFYGELEKDAHPELVARVKTTAREIKNATLVELIGASHSMREKSYTDPLLREIKKTENR